jgi:SAM-dependent methyltransferase
VLSLKSSSGSTRRRADLSHALAQYRTRASRYDAELVPYEPLRTLAIAQLAPQPGEVVLDVGCGTGLSFEGLLQGVGPRGHVVGVEPCGEMLAKARERVARCGWKNVALVHAGAGEAALPRQADALLLHFTHDVMRDEVALAHLLQHLKPGGRVVAAGLSWAPPWLWPTNGLVLLAALYSVTSLEGLGAPWDRLGAHVEGLEVRHPLPGFYVASARKRAARHSREGGNPELPTP